MASSFPHDFDKRFGAARACFNGSELAVSTGRVRRVWRMTRGGLQTVSLRAEQSGREWIESERNAGCDWRIYRLAESGAKAVLTEASARMVKGEGGLADRLQVELVFQYPATEVELRYVIWAFPDGNGLRTRLDLRALVDHPVEEEFWPGYLVDSHAESLSLTIGATKRMAVGYYNDTQHRNSLLTPMLKEERREGSLAGENIEVYDWANLLHVRRDGEGMVLVKESHKCVNQEGVDTGGFVLEHDRLAVTGLGLRINGYGDDSKWIQKDGYHECWANWCVLYAGDEAAGQQAVKEFDRMRFPHDPKRDITMNANTWGSAGAGKPSQDAAEEQNVLRELESCADLGIDVLQIDDGWSVNDEVNHTTTDWRPLAPRFPNGWDKVRRRAEELGMKLGLWAACSIPLERLKENCDLGGFLYLKLDFANLKYRHLVDALLRKAEAIDRHNGHRGRINWDLTEVTPRMGYFLGREYGHLYPRNVQCSRPGTQRTKHVEYLPEVCLRDAWQYARHLNLNQFYLTIQNKDRFDETKAGRYSHAYCFAITMMGIPTFFQETQLYSQSARDELRPLIALYKRHREQLLGGYVSPVGNEPNGRSWTGFHCRVSASEGYLTLFREVDNPNSEHVIELPDVAAGEFELTDLVAGASRKVDSRELSALACSLSQPASFLFLRYCRAGAND